MTTGFVLIGLAVLILTAALSWLVGFEGGFAAGQDAGFADGYLDATEDAARDNNAGDIRWHVAGEDERAESNEIAAAVVANPCEP